MGRKLSQVYSGAVLGRDDSSGVMTGEGRWKEAERETD